MLVFDVLEGQTPPGVLGITRTPEETLMPPLSPLMSGSPTTQQKLNDVLARAEGILTQEGAQEFVDTVSAVYQFPLDDTTHRF